MLEKIVKNAAELNAAAMHLRQSENIVALKKLAKEWGVPYEQTMDFIHGKRYRLVEIPIADRNFRTPFEKLREEMLALDDKYFADIIGWYLIQKCREDEKFSEQVLKKQKSLQRCLDFITGKVFEVVAEQAKQKGQEGVQQNTGIAMTEKEVFPWAEEYYCINDEAETEKRAEEEKKRIIAAWDAAEKKRTHTGKAAPKKKAESGKATKSKKKADKDSTAETKGKEKESLGQMSLFDLPQ